MAARSEAQRLTRAFDDVLRPHDLTINQFSMLARLILAGATPISQLAAALGIDRTTMTRNVTRSEKRGLVEAVPGKDGRERLIEITAAGRALADAAFPAWDLAQQNALRASAG